MNFENPSPSLFFSSAYRFFHSFLFLNSMENKGILLLYFEAPHCYLLHLSVSLVNNYITILYSKVVKIKLEFSINSQVFETYSKVQQKDAICNS